MKRRKLLIGLGALAAGGSAAIGTGAFSRTEANRGLTAEVVGDETAYLEIDTWGANSETKWIAQDDSGNPTYEDGEFHLDFDEDPNYDQFPTEDGVGNEEAHGLNLDAVTWFDRAFRIHNDGTEEVKVWFANVPGRVQFYHNADRSSSLHGRSNGVDLKPFDDAVADGDADNDGNNDPDTAEMFVGVRIDATGITDPQTLWGGSDNNFTIVADDTGDGPGGGGAP